MCIRDRSTWGFQRKQRCKLQLILEQSGKRTLGEVSTLFNSLSTTTPLSLRSKRILSESCPASSRLRKSSHLEKNLLKLGGANDSTCKWEIALRALMTARPRSSNRRLERLKRYSQRTDSLRDSPCKTQVGELLQTIRKVPVLKIARIAGQYAKPRSDTHEIVNGEKVLVYRGDIVDYNDPSKRDADPARIQEAYLRSVATFNHIKNRDLALTGSDLSDKDKSGPIFTSHEALLLEYEEALVREYENEFYATSGHFLWIGERTRQIDGAHVEFFRGLKNPIGVKLGPTISALELRELLKILNPNNEEGKIVLITRMGVSKIEAALPPLIQEVKNNNHNVIWVCDPMHGNTVKINGYKTRKVQDLTDELLHSIRIFKENGLSLQGIHFESSPFEVTECIGGKTKVIEEVHLPLCYTTLCDPRLNLPQCLDIVEAISTAFQS
eukprot:TRINITY_DN3059_c0_g1_i8.p1 TRINITY_DN3059_c0_g1~~TRINITY_DN3059_c0_g1_i8.p1  ORF type:complete len:485 (+),score=74.82 TRINITY_DN3059_c0_g1_i8:136-1455(+)